MISPQYDALVRGEQYHDLLREAAKERSIKPVARSFIRRQSLFHKLFEWLVVQVTRLRCAVFPFSAAPVCAP